MTSTRMESRGILNSYLALITCLMGVAIGALGNDDVGFAVACFGLGVWVATPEELVRFRFRDD